MRGDGQSDVEGTRYPAVVPDTLDLVDRAELALNGMGGSLDPDCGYEQYFWVRYRWRPPYMLHAAFGTTIDPEFGESFAMMRTMCGSDVSLEGERGLAETLVSRLSPEDGLYYALACEKRPWHSIGHEGYDNIQEDFSNLAADGLMMRTLLTWRERDGDSRWDDSIARMAKGLNEIAIHKDDYAYYPDGGFGECFSFPRSGWRSTTEPMSAHDGGEGDAPSYQSIALQGLARWYAASGDTASLELARKVTNFCMMPKFWGGNPEPVGVAGNEQGHVDSHFHNRACTLRAILEYAKVANDDRAAEFVRRGYEYMRTFAIPRLGYVTTWPGTEYAQFCEGCMLGDWVALGIRLSDLGTGDYWDDVDQCVRNHLVEGQLVRADLLQRVSDEGAERPAGSSWDWKNLYERSEVLPGQETTDNVIGRTLGIYGATSEVTSIPNTWVMQCCTAHATQGLYYAWEGTVRCPDGRNAQINLLLNRASPWLDIDSYLPYEGKVSVKNKTCERVAVRMPSWVNRNQIRADVDGQLRTAFWAGNYMIFDGLKPEDRLTLQFPVEEHTAKYTTMAHIWKRSKTYSCTFRGNTAVDIAPRDDSPGSYPLYQRDHLKSAGPAPTKNITRFIPSRVIRDW